MGFLRLAGCCLRWLCLGGGLWKGICSLFHVFEGVSGSGSLLTVRPVSLYFLWISSLRGLVSCHNLWGHLAAFSPIPCSSCFDDGELWEHRFISAHRHALEKSSYEGGQFIVAISRCSRQTQGSYFILCPSKHIGRCNFCPEDL